MDMTPFGGFHWVKPSLSTFVHLDVCYAHIAEYELQMLDVAFLCAV